MRFSIAIHCIVGETRDEAMDRARAIYDLRARDQSFDNWFVGAGEQRLFGSVDEVAAALPVCRGWRRSANGHAQPAHRPRLNRPDRRTPGTSARTLSGAARCAACRSSPAVLVLAASGRSCAANQLQGGWVDERVARRLDSRDRPLQVVELEKRVEIERSEAVPDDEVRASRAHEILGSRDLYECHCLGATDPRFSGSTLLP